jgi:hypothetical protein
MLKVKVIKPMVMEWRVNEGGISKRNVCLVMDLYRGVADNGTVVTSRNFCRQHWKHPWNPRDWALLSLARFVIFGGNWFNYLSVYGLTLIYVYHLLVFWFKLGEGFGSTWSYRIDCWSWKKMADHCHFGQNILCETTYF